MKNKKHLCALMSSIVWLLLFTGCDMNDPIDTTQSRVRETPFWTLEAVIDDTGTVPAAQMTDVRAAIVWQKRAVTGEATSTIGNETVTVKMIDVVSQIPQTLPVNISVNSAFKLEFFELPPLDALGDVQLEHYFSDGMDIFPDEIERYGINESRIRESWSGRWPYGCGSHHVNPQVSAQCPNQYFQFTVGYLVLFNDNNHNGILDMSQDGKTFSDVVIGSAPDYTFLYVESEVARPVPAIPEIKRGLSISRGIPGTIDGYRVPINTTLEITLQQDLLNQAFMCSNGNLHLSMFDHGRSSNGLFKGEVVDVENMHAHFPGMIVAGRDGFCDVSGRTFTWYDGEAPANLGEVCFDENNSEVYVLNKVTTGIKVAVLPPDGTMPDWWPCANVPPRIHYWAFPNANEFECFEYMNDVLIFDAFGQLTESYFQETGISNIAFDDWKLLCEAVAPYAPEILDAQKIFNNELLFEFEGNELIYKYE